MLFNISLTLFFVFLNGFFVAAEFAIVKVRSSQIELRFRSGSKVAAITKHLISHPDSYLSATQLGITLASLGLGWIGESVVSQIIGQLIDFAGFTIDPGLTHKIALPVAFVTITVLHIVLGEQAPKTLAIQRPESVALGISIPLRIFYFVFKPFIWTLNSAANMFVRMIGVNAIGDEPEKHSEEEIRLLLEESSKSGIIDKSDHELIENVFEFSETPIKQIMVPRNRIVAVELSTSGDEIIEKFIEEGYSRMPVFKKSIDNIIGEIYAKDVISMMANRNLIILQDIIRTPFFVQEDHKINELLRSLQKNRKHLAIVLDEFGGIAGLVTLEDILEEIVGEIQDEYDEEPPAVVKVSDKVFLVKASTSIDDANDFLPLPLPDSDDYETVGGLITNEIGRIPDKGEIIELDDYNCEIIKRSKSYIELVKLILYG